MYYRNSSRPSSSIILVTVHTPAQVLDGDKRNNRGRSMTQSKDVSYSVFLSLLPVSYVYLISGIESRECSSIGSF